MAAGKQRAAAAIVLAVGLVLGFSLGRFSARSPAAESDPLESARSEPRIGRASSPAPASPGAEPIPGSRSAEGSPATGLAPGADAATADAGAAALAALSERLAQIGPRQVADPTREIIEARQLLLALDEDQLPAALRRLENLGASPSVLHPLLATLFLRWAELDAAAALERAESLSDPQLRSTASQAVLSAWAEEDPRAAWDYVMSQDARTGQFQLFVAIATRDPQWASALTRQIEDPGTRNRAYISLASFWANADPRAALGWANALDDAAARRQILPIILGTMGQQDPGTALDLALAEADASIRQPAVTGILARAVRSDPDAGLALLDRLPDDFPIESVAMILGGALSAADADDVSAYVDRLPEGNARANLLKTLIQIKVNRGADEEALLLLDLLPEGAGRASLYRTFAQGWARDDPRGVSEWLEQLPTGRERDQAVQGFSWALLESDPEGALLWATGIDEPRRRDGQLRALAQQWLRRDPDAAAAWIGSRGDLSAYVPERLQRPAGR